MPAKTKTSIESLIAMLEEEMATFSDVPLPLLSYQLNGFESYYGILRESEESLAGLSRQRRSERTRICDLLADVFVAVGAEVFLLCVFAVPITALAAITPKSCIRSLQTWWNATTSRPRALKLAVEQICKPLCIGALVSSLRKRKILNVESGSEQCLLLTLGIGAQSYGADQVEAAVAEQEQGSPHDSAPQCTSDHNGSEELATTMANHIDEGATSGSGSPNPAAIIEEGQGKRKYSGEDAPSPKRILIGSSHIPIENGQYCSFAFTECRMIEEVPEPFRTGIKTSKLWKAEREGGGLEVTNCLTMVVPETAGEDVFLVVRLGYNEGFKTLNLLGLGNVGIVGSTTKVETETR